MATLTVNGKSVSLDVPDDMPLLWALRDVLGLTGTKVRLRHGAVRRLHRAHRRPGDALLCHHAGRGGCGKAVTTIEGIGRLAARQRCRRPGSTLNVPQCGYCQSGPDHVRRRLAPQKPAAHRRGHRRRDGRQHLPLRHLSAHPRSDQARRAVRCGRRVMSARAPDARSSTQPSRLSSARAPRAAWCCCHRLPRLARRRERSTAPTRMPHGWVRRSAGLRRHRRRRHRDDRLPPSGDGAGCAHQPADGRRRRARGGLAARARAPGARRRAATATRTRTARAACATSSSRCAAAARRHGPCSSRRRPRAGGYRSPRCTPRNHEVLHRRRTAASATARSRARPRLPVPAARPLRLKKPASSATSARAESAGGRRRHRRPAAPVRHRHRRSTACCTPSIARPPVYGRQGRRPSIPPPR